MQLVKSINLSFEHWVKALSSIIEIFERSIICSIDVLLNDFCDFFSNWAFWANSIFLSVRHPENALFPMILTLECIETCVKAVKAKAKSLIEEILESSSNAIE